MKFKCEKATGALIRTKLENALKLYLTTSKNRDDEMVLKYGDTIVTYPMWCAGEIDAKSPEDWINSNIFTMARTGFKGEIEFTLKKAK